MKKQLCVVFVLFVIGCSRSDRFSVSSPEELRAEFDRISATLRTEEAAEFKTAFEVLVDLAVSEAFLEGDVETRVLARFNGKTAKEVIEEYKQLSVVVITAEAELTRLRTEAEKAGLDGTGEYISAMRELMKACDERLDRDGEYKAFCWLEEQLVGKTPQQIIAAYSKEQPASHEAGNENSGRSQSSGILKELAIALHNYHDAAKSFPPAYNTDQDDKPLLSWRVHLLPYLKQQALYSEFHLDEPWDSEHNMTLISRMPDIFRCPQSKSEPGKTNYLGVGGDHGVFPGRDAVSFPDITDGTLNAIMIVEVNDVSAIIWTKPKDFVPDANDPKQGLLGMWQGGFLAGFADGSSKFIRDNIDAESLLALFSRHSGKSIDRDSL